MKLEAFHLKSNRIVSFNSKPHIVMVNGQWTVRMRPQPTPLDKLRYRMYKQAHRWIFQANLLLNYNKRNDTRSTGEIR